MIKRTKKKANDLVNESNIVESFEEPVKEEAVPVETEPVVEEVILAAPMPEEEIIPTRDHKEVVEDFVKAKESVDYFKANNIEELKNSKLPEELKLRAAAAMLFTKAETEAIASEYVRKIFHDIDKINNMEVFYDDSVIADLIGNIVALKKYLSLYGEVIDLPAICSAAVLSEEIENAPEFNYHYVTDLKYQLERIKELASNSKASNKEDIANLVDLEIWNLLK